MTITNTTTDEGNKDAKIGAQFVNAARFHQHRRAIEWGVPHQAFIFGNDGYGDPSDPQSGDLRTRIEVGILRQYLEEAGLTEIGFAVAGDEGETWGMMVQGTGVIDIDEVHEMVVEAWRIATDSRIDDPKWWAFRAAQGL